jgi:hypothetical protein
MLAKQSLPIISKKRGDSMKTNPINRSHSRSADRALMFFLLVIVASCLVVLSGCTSAVRVSAERDRTVSFEQYRTYAWIPPDQKDWQSNIFVRNQAGLIQNTVGRELEVRGMMPDTAAPDVLLRYSIGTQDHAAYRRAPVYGYASFPFFFGRSFLYGAYNPMYSNYRTVIREGILNVEMIDRKTNNVVWRGLSAQRLYSRADANVDIPKIIHAMFEQYPVRPIVSVR